MLTEPATKRLLEDLCTKLGMCLPPAEQLQLQQHPPVDVQTFTAAVFLAEGLDVELVPRHLYSQVRTMVASAFDRCGGEHC